VARAAIESLAENFADGVVAPVFWYVLAGLPGLMAYKAINTLDSMIGYRDERYRAFGWASARLDDLVNLIPARLAGIIMALAATFAPGGNPIRGLKTMIADGTKHPSPNSGWPEAAMAGGLDFALGGPRRYAGGITEGQWIGLGRATLAPADIDRALLAFFAACLINAGAAVWVLGMLR
jgi:adenosylcobinamide-phosphate synthase